MSDEAAENTVTENAFTEDDVANDFVDAIDTMVGQNIGQRARLGRYDWGGDEDDEDSGWPFTVVRDGREFEVDIDVRVTELTPERKEQREAQRKADVEATRAAIKRHEARRKEERR